MACKNQYFIRRRRSGFVRKEYCMLVCNDKQKAQIRLLNAKRILTGMRRYENMHIRNRALTEKEKWEMGRLNAFTPLHMTCGHCPYVNKNELRMIEDKIRELAYKLYLYYSENPGHRHEAWKIYRSLCCHYPVLARLYADLMRMLSRQEKQSEKEHSQ
jgi:hypothetical protein